MLFLLCVWWIAFSPLILQAYINIFLPFIEVILKI